MSTSLDKKIKALKTLGFRPFSEIERQKYPEYKKINNKKDPMFLEGIWRFNHKGILIIDNEGVSFMGREEEKPLEVRDQGEVIKEFIELCKKHYL